MSSRQLCWLLVSLRVACADLIATPQDQAPPRQLRPARRERFFPSSALRSSQQTPLPPEEPPASGEELVNLVPVNAAGFKCEDSALVEAAGAKCSLLAKSFGPLGCQRVLADLAAERGKSLEGVPQAFRSRRVADACPYSCGLCDTCAPGCARWFIGNGWCEPDCNNKACQWDGGDCWETDCVVGPWSELSSCSITCDPRAPTGSGGVQTRTRSVKIKPSQGGKQCPSLEEKVYGCNANVLCPVECEVSVWGPWSSCSAECGAGQSTRKRTVLRPPAHGAVKCPELKQSRPCLLTECSSPCEVSEWSEWSECSSECEGGTQFRTRSIEALPVGDGQAYCPALFEERTCNAEKCTTLSGQSACPLSEWGNWSPCSAACGGGVQVRQRHIIDESCGAEVSMEELEEGRDCNTFECIQDCVLSGWSEWSECDVLCDEGRQSRSREILTISSTYGRPCSSTIETRRCYQRPCATDCEVSNWTEWSECTTATGDCGAGTRMRSRSALVVPANGGQPCPHLSEFEDCMSTPCSDREKCQISLTVRSDASVCEESCQIAADNTDPLYTRPVQWRRNLIEYFSLSCTDGDAEQVTACDGVCEPKPADCLVSEWSPWTACTKKCGGGERTRVRTIVREAQVGGKRCPALTQTEACGISPCPIDCKLGEWSGWSTCTATCGLGTQLRSRPILSPANSHFLAEPCGPVTQVAPCFGRQGACARDCLVADWSRWSACDQDCDGGLRRRQREITQQPIGLTASCPAVEEVEVCNSFPCPVDCLVSEWSDWSECSASCASMADGEQTRTRSVIRSASAGGQECPADLIESRRCRGADSCEKVHCQMGRWSECSAECGEDMIYRDPIPPFEGSGISVCFEKRQTAPCFAGPCVVDCQVGAWTDWEACSAECGGGDQKRTREIVVTAANGGKVCPHLWDVRRCNEKPCAEVESLNDCVLSAWSAWAPCSQTCGGGVTSRTRTVDRAPVAGGAICGALLERKGCNLQRCPGAACEDNPRLVENGITCNILKTQGCTTGLWDLARTHNVELPFDVPPEARVQDACPLTCGVCEECAPGCELRDLGNTVCTPECDNDACDFDRGDCGGDCLLPSDLSGGEFIVKPSVTALQEGQEVELRCPSGRRFSKRSALDFVTLACGTTAGQPLSLHLLPTPDAIIGETEEDISQMTCQLDTCPFVLVEGFKSDLSLFNGIYVRDVEQDDPHTHSMYRRRAGKRALTFNAEEAVKGDDSQLKWRFVEPADQAAVQLLPDVISSSCAAPAVIGADLAPDCSSEWIVDAGGHSTFELEEELSLRCLSVEEKLGLKSDQRKKVRPSTRIPTGPSSSMPLRCEDIKMVEQVSGYSCAQLERAVGCDFLLSETGHKLPPFLPSDATVAFVCPDTCDQCVECDDGCAVWFLGNGFCDPACDNEACNFDEGDCSGSNYFKAEDRLLEPAAESTAAAVSSGTGSLLVANDCVDSPMVAEMGFTCQLLKMGATLAGFPECDMTLTDLARSQGMEITLPDGVPSSARILDACPVTCECCKCDRLTASSLGGSTESAVSTAAAAAAAVSTDTMDPLATTEVSACSDSDLVEDQSGFTCGEIYHLLGRCDLTLGELGYLPDGMDDSITLTALCPFSCGTCTNSRLPAYKCHDFPALQTLSGFSCEQAVTLLTPAVCTKALSSFGYEMPAAIPATATLAEVCPDSCSACPAETTEAVVSMNSEEAALACTDSNFVYDITGFECHDLVDLQGDCTLELAALGYVIPDTVPAQATLAQACPQSCNTCPLPAAGSCEDSKIVASDLRQTCAKLVETDGCATLISASTLVKTIPSSISADVRIGDLCRSTCQFCGADSSDQDGVCRDHPAVEQAGYSCTLFLQFAAEGCQTPLLRLLGRGASLPAGVPASTTIQDACPKTCQVCTDTSSSAETAKTAVCEDSPVMAAVSLSCSQVISMAGGGGEGCVATVTSIAGSSGVTAMLPDGMRIMDLCQRSCQLCGKATCDDGYLNGNETNIDCGGNECRPCRSCSSSTLKTFAEGIVTVPVDTEDFSDGAKRIVGCSDQYQTTSSEVETIVCADGIWSSPKTKCEERSIELWRGTIGLTHGADFDFSVIAPLLKSWSTVMQLVDADFDKDLIRVAAGGSCTAMSASSSGSDTECEDNALVEDMGYGCSMLAALGCTQSLAALAAIQGEPLPAGIPDDALVSDACPVTCDTCEESIARMAEYMATLSDADDPLGSDCFKVDLLMQSDEDVPVRVQAALGNIAAVTKLTAAAFRDALVESNITVFTNFTAAATIGEAVVAKSLQSALSFVASRPVDLVFAGPISESSGSSMDMTSSGGSTVSTLFLPFEKENVTLSKWKQALTPQGTRARARAVYQSSGIKPIPHFSVPIATLQTGLTPAVRSEEDLINNDLVGYYYGDAPLGATLDSRVSRIRKCEDPCCHFKETLQEYLDGPCGILLLSSVPTVQDLSQFCRVPESSPGVTSCLAEGLSMLHPFRDQGEAGCQAAEMTLDMLRSVCAQNAETGEHCLLSMSTDLKDVSYSTLTLKTKENLDLLCEESSCWRSHFRYLSAVSALTVAYSMETYDGETANTRLLLPSDDVSVKLRAQFARLQPHRRLADRVKRHLSLPTLSRFTDYVKASDFARLATTDLYADFRDSSHEEERSTLRRLAASIADEKESSFILSIDQLGNDLLDLVCVQVNGDYCQRTLQLLAEDNPIETPSIVDAPCASECFRVVTGRVGEILYQQGINFKAPRQLALGTLMTHYARFACLQNEQNVQCRQATTSTALTNYQRVFNISLTNTYSATSECSSACASSFLGDGICDPVCFTPQCGFDKSDCLVWNMFPETFARHLSTLCLDSITDKCNPLRIDFDCQSCSSRLKTCLVNHGCCYAGALEALRTTMQAQKDLMIKVQEQSAELTNVVTFYDQFDLEKVPMFYQKNCSALTSLDRTCANGHSYTQYRLGVEIGNLREQSSRRRLQQTTQVESLNSFMQDPTVIFRLASHFHLVPSDLGRVMVRSMRDDRTIVELDLDAGQVVDFNTRRAELPDVVLRILEDSPAFWVNIVNKTLLPDAELMSVQTITGTPEAVPAVSLLDGAWGMGTLALQSGACPTSTIWTLAAKGMVLTKTPDISKDALTVAHGSTVSVTCLSGYVKSSDTGLMVCDNGMWTFQQSFTCLLPCTSDPLNSLGLSESAVYIQPRTANALSSLFSPKELLQQTILSPGNKYPSGSSILLSCVDGYTADIASEWGVAATTCVNGKWSKVMLDCQPRCPMTMPFMEETPQAYLMSNGNEARYGGVRGLECAGEYFAIPPSYEGTSTTVVCGRNGEWSSPAFRCVAGLTIDPSGGLNTVQKMLRTLFSTTGIVSLAIFFAAMVIIVIFIAIFWKLFYRKKADKAYAEQRRLLREYLASTVTGATTTESAEDEGFFGTLHNEDSQPPMLDETSNLQHSSALDDWHGRSPSSSTVSAVRRVVLLAGTNVLNRPSDSERN